MSKKILIITTLVVICFSSCKKNKQRNDARKIVSEWAGKEIMFPGNVPCYVSGLETFPEVCKDCFQKEFKILLYVDSAGCSDCRLKLFEWKQLIEEADSLFPGKVGFLLYFQPKSAEEMADLFLINRFDYPVFIDTTGSINRLNGFPQVIQHQCYLLDEAHKVLAIGNPALNIQIWELYKKIISNKKKSELGMHTAKDKDKTAHNLKTYY